jgi:hypothetical protein
MTKLNLSGGILALAVLFIAVFALALFSTPTMADSIVSDIDSECQKFGYDYAVSMWIWNGEEYTETVSIEDYSIDVTGNANQAEWTANQEVSGVLSHETCNYQVLFGGNTGSINAISQSYSINHITFCKDDLSEDPEDEESEDEQNDGEVPEFGAIAFVMIVFAAGFYVYKKRD